MKLDPDRSEWWQTGVIYQVYPRSFQDTDADGVGDLAGLLRRLDYLVWLGIKAVWISPIFPSPMADFGYDVSEYCDIDPIFGTLADFDCLITAAHERGLKIILDLVPNHTSDEHPWFRDSRSSRSHPRRNWYVWRDPGADGGPPNNWLSEFGGAAWTLDSATGQYYYHAYLRQQPDLNWREPAVQNAVFEVMRFWLRRGVDGFRVDAVHMLVEHESLCDNPPNPQWRPGMSPAKALLREYTADQPETHDAIARMRQVLDEYPGRVLIGEAYLPIDKLMRYYGVDLSGFHLPFNFHLLSTPWKAPAIADLVQRYEAALPAGGWPNWVLGNHDRSRMVTRLGGIRQARLAALLLLTLRGTPTVYNGDEIGMGDVAIASDQVQDPWEKDVPGLGLGRDPCRTPMQWDDTPGAGFTTGTPWLPFASDLQATNVAAQAADSASLLSLYRRLIRLRQVETALSTGSYRQVQLDGELLVYERTGDHQRLLIALNFACEDAPLRLPSAGLVIASTHAERPVSDASTILATTLCAFEGIVLRVPY